MPETPEELKQLFEKCDTDTNGTIEWDEFCAVIDELIGKKSLQEKTGIFAQIDTNKTGVINFREFCAWWAKR